MTESSMDKYLGDGVYASFDGWHILLELKAQTPVHRIALEPEVFDALLRYKENLNKEKAK